jgi:hypothetical protein
MVRIASLLFVGKLVVAAPMPIRPVALEYEKTDGAQSCPDQAALEQAVTIRLGQNPFSVQAPKKLRLRLARVGHQLQAVLTSFTAEGTEAGNRVLSSSSLNCSELAAALEFALVLAIDPSGRSKSSQTIIIREQSNTPPPQPIETPSAPTSIGLSAGLVTSTGIATAVAFGPTLGAQLKVGVFSAELQGRSDFALARASSRGSYTSVAFSGWGSGCLHRAPVFGCAGER